MDLDRNFVGYEKLAQLTAIIKNRIRSDQRQVEFLEQRQAIEEHVG